MGTLLEQVFHVSTYCTRVHSWTGALLRFMAGKESSTCTALSRSAAQSNLECSATLLAFVQERLFTTIRSTFAFIFVPFTQPIRTVRICTG